MDTVCFICFIYHLSLQTRQQYFFKKLYLPTYYINSPIHSKINPKINQFKYKTAITCQKFQIFILHVYGVGYKRQTYSFNEPHLFLFQASLTAISIATFKAILLPRYHMTILSMRWKKTSWIFITHASRQSLIGSQYGVNVIANWEKTTFSQ